MRTQYVEFVLVWSYREIAMEHAGYMHTGGHLIWYHTPFGFLLNLKL